jgi:hypothetical protein
VAASNAIGFLQTELEHRPLPLAMISMLVFPMAGVLLTAIATIFTGTMSLIPLKDMLKITSLMSLESGCLGNPFQIHVPRRTLLLPPLLVPTGKASRIVLEVFALMDPPLS